MTLWSRLKSTYVQIFRFFFPEIIGEIQVFAGLTADFKALHGFRKWLPNVQTKIRVKILGSNVGDKQKAVIAVPIKSKIPQTP